MGRPFGQHFLRDTHVVQDILHAAEISSEDHVLEIGPGQGVLTEPLSQAAAKVTAVEADPAMAEPLTGRFQNVEVILKDVLQVDLAAHGPFSRIVANLPYQISGPVTAQLLGLLPGGWDRAVLMYQKEFAERLLAGPGTKKYGRQSVHVARWCDVTRLRNVKPGAFDPPPRVDSTIIVLQARSQPLFHVQDEARLHAIVDAAFAQRRKKLRNSLSPLVDAAHLDDLDVADLRPEQVAPEVFGRLADGPMPGGA